MPRRLASLHPVIGVVPTHVGEPLGCLQNLVQDGRRLDQVSGDVDAEHVRPTLRLRHRRRPVTASEIEDPLGLTSLGTDSDSFGTFLTNRLRPERGAIREKGAWIASDPVSTPSKNAVDTERSGERAAARDAAEDALALREVARAADRLPERHGFTAVANTNSAGHSNPLPLRYGASDARYSPATFARTSGAKSDHG